MDSKKWNEKIQNNFNNAAYRYLEHSNIQKFFAKKIVQFIKELNPQRKGEWIDLGSGPGLLADEIEKNFTSQIDKDFKSWVNLHNPFFEIINFMQELRKRGIKTGVITTKSKIFAEKIIKQFNIVPEFIFGYESGTKIKIIEKLAQTYEILGFIEDRKETLIDIKKNSETSHIPCFLADWGYLKELDRYNLSNEIKLLKLGSLEKLVAI